MHVSSHMAAWHEKTLRLACGCFDVCLPTIVASGAWLAGAILLASVLICMNKVILHA